MPLDLSAKVVLSDDIGDARNDDDLRCLECLQVFGYSGKSRA